MTKKNLEKRLKALEETKSTKSTRKPFQTIEEFKANKITREEAIAILEDSDEPFAKMQLTILKSPDQ
jgi:hypothetical protein